MVLGGGGHTTLAELAVVRRGGVPMAAARPRLDSSIVFPQGSGKGDARMQFHQKDKPFVDHLWNLFDAIGLVGAPPIELSRFDQRTGKTYLINTFQTFTLPFFTDLHQKCYRQVDGKNVKVLPGNIAAL